MIAAMPDIQQVMTEAQEKLGSDRMMLHAWPEVFSSTAGPRMGIAGQVLTTFQVMAFEDVYEGKGLMWCAGLWKDWDPNSEKSWQ